MGKRFKIVDAIKLIMISSNVEISTNYLTPNHNKSPLTCSSFLLAGAACQLGLIYFVSYACCMMLESFEGLQLKLGRIIRIDVEIESSEHYT